MTDATCRSCGEPVATNATACPHCGAVDPALAAPHGGEPGAERDAGTASRLGSALKALGCLVIAGIVLGIAILVGLLDVLF